MILILQWSITSLFFATSHGIGGTIKRKAAYASLRVTVTNQILTPEQLFLWAKENINGVTMYYVTEEDIISHKRKHDLKACYNGVQTVLGTCTYHFFIPDGDSLIMKRISVDTMMFNNLMTQTSKRPYYLSTRQVQCMLLCQGLVHWSNTWVLKWKLGCKSQIHDPKRIKFAVGKWCMI